MSLERGFLRQTLPGGLQNGSSADLARAYRERKEQIYHAPDAGSGHPNDGVDKGPVIFAGFDPRAKMMNAQRHGAVALPIARSESQTGQQRCSLDAGGRGAQTLGTPWPI